MSRGSTWGEEEMFHSNSNYYYYYYYYYSTNKINLFIHFSPFIPTAIESYPLS